ncbi:MAG TPA: DUF4835 family protein [Alloprevotella sp.]|nr:DUF4835 family protein [Alloprevotella sp.]
MQSLRLTVLSFVLSICFSGIYAQELDARVTVNHQQIQGTNVSVFENLQTALTEFLNDRQWTNMQYRRNERINCNFNITVSKYVESENRFECSLVVQSTRPVYNATYTTTVFSMRDPNFNFTYQEYDKLDFRPDLINNDLTAMVAYYAYLIIGLDMDTMSPKGGTEILQIVQTITNNAQSLTTKGWKAFEDSKNRYAVINDYLDSGMENFRQMQYKYYREGMDVMAENAERGRAGITGAMTLLKEARTNKPMSMLPQIFTEYKRDELVSIYKGKGAPKEKESIYETLMGINASQSSYWNKLKQ